MITGRVLVVAGFLLILVGLLLGLVGATYKADTFGKPEASCGSPWFPSIDTADAARCNTITEPRAELATGLVVLGGIALIASATPRRAVAA